MYLRDTHCSCNKSSEFIEFIFRNFELHYSHSLSSWLGMHATDETLINYSDPLIVY